MTTRFHVSETGGRNQIQIHIKPECKICSKYKRKKPDMTIINYYESMKHICEIRNFFLVVLILLQELSIERQKRQQK